jgi:hypothetical protein
MPHLQIAQAAISTGERCGAPGKTAVRYVSVAISMDKKICDLLIPQSWVPADLHDIPNYEETPDRGNSSVCAHWRRCRRGRRGGSPPLLQLKWLANAARSFA